MRAFAAARKSFLANNAYIVISVDLNVDSGFCGVKILSFCGYDDGSGGKCKFHFRIKPGVIFPSFS